MKKIILTILFVFSVSLAQMQPDILAWKNAPKRIVYEYGISNAGTALSKISVRFTQIGYKGDWLILAQNCVDTYKKHFKGVFCFAYPTARHLDAAMPPKNNGFCWVARSILTLSGTIERQRQDQKTLKLYNCPSE